MMLPNTNLQAKQPTNKEDNQSSSSNRKTAGGGTSSTRPQDQQALKCPRCDSPNTKFCYYNNYSLTQPRHFCKTCRRYWTKGGALRNVPIGGGCRKNKKIKSSSSRLSCDSKDSSGSSEIGGFKFFHGLSPAMDFNMGGLSFPRLNPSPTSGIFNQFSSFGELSAATSAAGAVSVTSPPCFNLDPSVSSTGSLMGFNYPLTSGFSGAIQENIGGGGCSMNINTNLATSIESLSSINQDLHWKLQQQRLAMLFGQDQKDSSVENQQQAQKLQPILFQNLEISKPDVCGGVSNSRKDDVDDGATEWFFGNNPYGQGTGVNPTPTNSNNNGNNDNNTGNWNTTVQAWGHDLQQHHHQYNALP